MLVERTARFCERTAPFCERTAPACLSSAQLKRGSSPRTPVIVAIDVHWGREGQTLLRMSCIVSCYACILVYFIHRTLLRLSCIVSCRHGLFYTCLAFVSCYACILQIPCHNTTLHNSSFVRWFPCQTFRASLRWLIILCKDQRPANGRHK